MNKNEAFEKWWKNQYPDIETATSYAKLPNKAWQAAKQDSAEQRHMQEPTAWYLRNDIRGIVLFHKDEVETYINDGYELICALYKE